MDEVKGRLATRVRKVLRDLHADAGNFVVGLTFVYALSGLAVNHIADWDPSFVAYETTHALGPLRGTPREVAREVMRRLGEHERPEEIYAATPERVDVTFASHSLHIDTTTGRVVDEGRRPRFLLRIVNYLHLNRGKAAWTYVADAYAVILLFLAFSGLTMRTGRKGLVGRAGIFLLLGIAVPVVYVLAQPPS